MADRPLETLVDELHRAAADGSAIPDGELLGRFLLTRDPAAFELVVWRHGAMVQAVCRRVLGRSPEVDDAFQATFLVLLRQARSIRQRESLAGWLHRVAYRAAQRCRRNVAARMRHEHAAARPEGIPPSNEDHRDLGPILHAEIDRLPDRLRQTFVLCCLEGRTNEEAARLLGVPHGTVLSRLSRARERLRWRLLRRGVSAAVGGVIVDAVAEPVSAALVESAVREALNSAAAALTGPAASLAQGVIHNMFLRKMRLIAAGLLAAAVVGGASLTGLPRLLALARAGDEPRAAKLARNAAPKPAERPDDPIPDKPPETPKDKPSDAAPADLLVPARKLRIHHEDEAKIIGTWEVTRVIADGEDRDPEDRILNIGPFGTMMVQVNSAKEGQPMTYKLSADMRPAGIDLSAGGKTQVGIYLVDGDDLQLCLSLRGDKRPVEFASRKGSNEVLFRLHRTHYSTETKWADKLFTKGRSHDFGTLKPGEPKTHKFLFKNIYDRPIGVIGSSFAPQNVSGATPMGAAGPGPMGGGGPVPGGFPMGGATGSFGPGNYPSWITADPLPTGWLQPGEEAEIVLHAEPSQIIGPAKLVVMIQFRVKGLERPKPPPSGGTFGAPMGANPGGSSSGRGGRGPQTEQVQSWAELTVSATTANERPR